MKAKILRTILLYLGIILLSCSIYLECGISRALAFFGTLIIVSTIYLKIEYDNWKNKIKINMKIKIIRTILLYLGILIFSYSIYLKHGFSEGFGAFGVMLAASVIYLWIEYSDLYK